MPKSYGTPGSRVISPDACTSQSLAQCSLGAQLLFDRLLVQSDDQGRRQADPLVVKADCLPLATEATVRKVAAWLRELEDAELVVLYRGGVPLLQIRQWWRYQGGYLRRAYPSRWPAPDGWQDHVRGLPGDIPPQDRGQGAAA